MTNSIILQLRVLWKALFVPESTTLLVEDRGRGKKEEKIQEGERDGQIGLPPYTMEVDTPPRAQYGKKKEHHQQQQQQLQSVSPWEMGKASGLAPS